MLKSRYGLTVVAAGAVAALIVAYTTWVDASCATPIEVAPLTLVEVLEDGTALTDGIGYDGVTAEVSAYYFPDMICLTMYRPDPESDNGWQQRVFNECFDLQSAVDANGSGGAP